MNNFKLNVLSHTRSLVTSDDLRPALLLIIGQITISLLGALLITNGILI